MAPRHDSNPLKGVARSLDDLFAQALPPEPAEAPAAASVPLPPEPEPAPEPEPEPEPQPEPEPEPEPALEVEVSVVDVVVAEAVHDPLSLLDATESALAEAEPAAPEDATLAFPADVPAAPDPEVERRARVRAATDSLVDAIAGLLAGPEAGPDAASALPARVRADAALLRDERALEPLVDAVERLAREAEGSASVELARELAGPPVVAAVVLRVAGARDDARREEIFRTCRGLSTHVAEALATALAEQDERSARRNLLSALAALGDDGLRQAERMVSENSPWMVVRNGVALLGELGGEKAVAHLMDTLRHQKPQVRQETLTALAQIGGESAALLVTGTLADEDARVRATAVRASASLKSERVVKLLLGRLDAEPDQDVQIEILRALGQIGDPLAVPAIEKRAVPGFFKRAPTELRIAAYRALAAIRTPHARKLVEAAVEDREPEVKAVARALVTAEKKLQANPGAARPRDA